MEACQPCLEEISETIKSEFPNYTKNKYIIFKYNGDRVKITNITGGDILEVAYIMSKKQRIL